MDVSGHPWVVWSTVIVAVLTVAVASIPKLRALFRPVYLWVADAEIRHLERISRIEKAGRALNDARSAALAAQLSHVAGQLEAVLAQGREAEARHAREMLAVNARLAAQTEQIEAQTREIAELRAELAEYRGRGDG